MSIRTEQAYNEMKEVLQRLEERYEKAGIKRKSWNPLKAFYYGFEYSDLPLRIKVVRADLWMYEEKHGIVPESPRLNEKDYAVVSKRVPNT